MSDDSKSINESIERIAQRSAGIAKLEREHGFIRGMNFAAEYLEHLHMPEAARALSRFLVADADRATRLASLDTNQRQDFLANLKPEQTR